MKKFILLSMGLILSFLTNGQTPAPTTTTPETSVQNEYYLEVISNQSGTINLTIGAYPQSISPNKRDDGSIFSIMKVALINGTNAQAFNWKDYKMYILTKQGELLYNFTTTAQYGDYACTYTIKPGETHLQFFCFEKLLAPADIDKVWIGFSDNKFIALTYFVDDKTKTPEEQAKQKITTPSIPSTTPTQPSGVPKVK
ncbi:MAG: hypothetical protein U0U66_01215 [Cytophagaceae bacterium]